ncbi:MAG: GTPase Era [Oligoflexia bacterium]|nr:GTPase Era [Oligoflexia bacterium]
MKAGFVTIIGVPNAGKSSLVNALIGENVSAVTSKPQTTRKRTLGILTKPNEYQIVFVDTPGVIENAQGELNQFLMKELNDSLKDIQVVLAAIAPWDLKQNEKPLALKMTENLKIPVIYVATQCDLKLIDMNKWAQFSKEPLLQTSAKDKTNLEELKNIIIEKLPQNAAYYAEDIYTNQTLRELSAEIIRKNCFENLHQEIPYGLAVNIRDFKEEKIYKIHADIVLTRDSHKAMVIGQGGSMIKKIGTASRMSMEEQFGEKVFLKLNVNVKPNWVKDKMFMQELGYE